MNSDTLSSVDDNCSNLVFKCLIRFKKYYLGILITLIYNEVLFPLKAFECVS